MTQSSWSWCSRRMGTGRPSMSGRGVVRCKIEDFKPVLPQDLGNVHQRFEGHGLNDEGVDAEVVGAKDILLSLRRGKNHNGNPPQGGIGLDLFQGFTPVLLRH